MMSPQERDDLERTVGVIQEFLDAKARKDKGQSFTSDPNRIALIYEYNEKSSRFKNHPLLRADVERLVAFVAAAMLEIKPAKESPSP